MPSLSLSSRRAFLHAVGLGLMGLPGLSGLFASAGTRAAAQSAPTGGGASALPALNRFPHMMQDWLTKWRELSGQLATTN